MIYKNFEYFLSIVKHRNITKAANELYISQPALSNYLKRLENKLGIKLFEQHSQPLRLTYAGERYLYYVNKYFSISKKMLNELIEIDSNQRGKVTIGISPWRSSYMLPTILPLFKERYPHIEVITKEGVENELIDLVNNNEVDFSIKSFFYPSTQFEHENIMNERILLAINKNNSILDTLGCEKVFDKDNINHIPFSDIKHENFILPRQSHELNKVIQQMVVPNKYRIYGFETGNVATALNLVGKNYGLTFVPESRIIHSNYFNDIIFFTVGNPILYWYLTIIYRNGAILPKVARIFIDEFKTQYKGNFIV